MSLTVDAIVQWMLKEVTTHRFLEHGQVIAYLQLNDPTHLAHNTSGNPVVPKSILAAFRKVTPDDVVWSFGGGHWRIRESYDPPTGRKVP